MLNNWKIHQNLTVSIGSLSPASIYLLKFYIQFEYVIGDRK